jgi:hypothetical protein
MELNHKQETIEQVGKPKSFGKLGEREQWLRSQ